MTTSVISFRNEPVVRSLSGWVTQRSNKRLSTDDTLQAVLRTMEHDRQWDLGQQERWTDIVLSGSTPVFCAIRGTVLDRARDAVTFVLRGRHRAVDHDIFADEDCWDLLAPLLCICPETRRAERTIMLIAAIQHFDRISQMQTSLAEHHRHTADVLLDELAEHDPQRPRTIGYLRSTYPTYRFRWIHHLVLR